MSKLSKAARQEERIKEGRKKKRLHAFLALSVVVANSWLEGLNGGNQVMDSYYPPITLPPKEEKFVRAQWEKILRWRDAVVAVLGIRSFERMGRPFFEEVHAKLEMAKSLIRAHLPDAPEEDHLRVLTYIVYTALYDLAILEQDTRKPMRYLVQTLGTLADHLIDRDSPLVDTMNKVYWGTRDAWQEYPDWTRGGEIEWGPSAQDLYLAEKAKAKA